MCTGCRSDAQQHREIEAIREALGVVAIAQPAVCWLYLGEDGSWWVRREGETEERWFPTRELAVAAVQLVVARFKSYCLYLQGEDGRVVRSQFN